MLIEDAAYEDKLRRCNTLQHTVSHCVTATHCDTLQHTATLCNTLQHFTTHYNTLQHTATHCNTLQHTATRCNSRDTKETCHKNQIVTHLCTVSLFTKNHDATRKKIKMRRAVCCLRVPSGVATFHRLHALSGFFGE